MLLNDILSRKIFHSHIPGVVVEFDNSSYAVNEDDGFVNFMIVKWTQTTLSITVNFSTVPGTAKGNVTLLILLFICWSD